MNKFTWKYVSNCVFLILVFINSCSLFSQTDSTVLFKRIIDAEYIIFSSDSSEQINSALLDLSYAYSETENYEKAISELLQINTMVLNKEHHYKRDIELSKNYYLSDRSDSALFYIEELKKYFPDSVNTNRVKLLNILALNDLGRFNESERLLSEVLSKKEIDIHKDTAYTNIVIHQPRSVKKAGRLSYLPGAGLIYAGEGKKAVVSITLITVFAAYTAASVYYGYYVSSFFTGFVNTMRFYRGGSIAAKNICDQKNILQKKKTALQLNLYTLGGVK